MNKNKGFIHVTLSLQIYPYSHTSSFQTKRETLDYITQN